MKIAASTLFALIFGAVLWTTDSQARERPNVLLILVDDLKPALGCYGDPAGKTPHLDRLAARGVRFDAAYCNQAVCAPSRYNLMLGSRSTSTGLYHLGSRLRETLPGAVTLPQLFARHGWRTESLGKVFHIGHGNEGDPQSFQAPHWREKVIEYADPASKGGADLTREEAFFENRELGRVNELPRGMAFERPDVADEAYADGRVAVEAARRLEQARARLDQGGEPFFMAVGFARPHLPFSAPLRYWEMQDVDKLPVPERTEPPEGMPAVAGKRGGEIANYAPLPDHAGFAAGERVSPELAAELVHGYYASMSYVDAQIGRVLEALERLELAESTIVVVWGDHGFHLGDLSFWTKHTNFEQATRIPLIFAGPGVTARGAATGQLAETVDILPTLADMAGLAVEVPQPMDGVSLKAVLKDPAARVRDHATHVFPRGRALGRAVRDERFRLVEWKIPGDSDERAEIELYDCGPGGVETRNIAAEHPEVVARLRLLLWAQGEARPVDAPAKPAKGKGKAKRDA
jgi:iduronate 2-sulfatase